MLHVLYFPHQSEIKMSLIQKLENSYLGILRVVVIAAASLLLLVAIVLGLFSLKGIFPSSEQTIETTAVNPKDVLAEIAPDEVKAVNASDKPAKEAKTKATFAHQAEFDKIFTKLDAFVKTYSKNTESINKDGLSKFLNGRLSQYDSEDLKIKYITGLISTVDASVIDVRVISRVERIATPAIAPVATVSSPEQSVNQTNETPTSIQTEMIIEEKSFKESPMTVVEKILDSYNDLFVKKVAEAKNKQREIAMEKLEAKAAATMQMYIAAGLFGVFLLVVFLSIVIKIERNLREIANKNPEASTPTHV